MRETDQMGLAGVISASPAGGVNELLLLDARRGDPRALAAIIRDHERMVFAVAGRILAGKGPPVEDVAQEVFLKVIRHLARFDPNGPATIGTWILTIATRTAIDALRRRGADGGEDELLALEDAADTPHEAAVGRELEERIASLMSAIPADQRAVLVLRAFHDLDYPEIASALGIEEGTVKSRLSRARSALKRLLGSKST